MNAPAAPMPRDLRPLLITLLIALVSGLAYAFIVPPWQHYDEPTHFEYAWLIAARGELPLPNDIDHGARVAIFESMVRNNFFGADRPGLPLDGSAPNIGITQLNDSPAYYLFIAQAIRPFLGSAVETQLYAGRVASLLFLLLTVACGWGVAARLTRAGHLLRWLLPGMLALLPAFVDLMSAVNNDGLAIAAYSLFIWSAVRWLQPADGVRGDVHAANALWMLAASALCYATKSTAVTAVPIAVLALALGLFRGRIRALAAAMLCGTALLIVPFAFNRGDTHAWYRNDASRTSLPTQCAAAQCGPPIDGGAAIRVSPGTYAYSQAYVFQSLPPAHTARIRGRVVTISAWMWTTDAAPLLAQSPWIGVNHRQAAGLPVLLTQSPQYTTYTATIPATAHYTRLVLPGHISGTVMFDGISVVPLSTVETAGNVIRNASGEAPAFALAEGAIALLDKVSPEWFSWPLTVSSLQDLRGTGWYYLIVLRNLFETFWLRIGWGATAPTHIAWMLMAACVTLLGIFGAFGALWRIRRRVSWSVAVFLLVCALATLAPTIPRSIIWGLEQRMYAPPMRYAMPAIIAFAVPLCAGWCELFDRIPKRWVIAVASGALMLALNAAALVASWQLLFGN